MLPTTRLKSLAARLVAHRRIIGSALGLLLFGTLGWVWWALSDLPAVERLADARVLPQESLIVGPDGDVLGRLGSQRRTVVAYDQFSELTRFAVLAAEDAEFFEHNAVNLRGVARALWTNLTSLAAEQGGSSITQQVARNALLESQHRTLTRKLRETVLAYQIEQRLSKHQILDVYLNSVYLGHGRYGFEQAAQYYFGRGVSELELHQAAVLAGIIASPENYSPRKSPERALSRRHFVLRQMHVKGFISEDRYREADARPLDITPTPETDPRIPEVAPVVSAKVAELREARPELSARFASGYRAVSTIDPTLQAEARRAVRRGLDRYLRRNSILPPFHPGDDTEFEPPLQGTPRPFVTYTGTVTGHDEERGLLRVQLGDVSGLVNLRREKRYNPKGLTPKQFAQVGAQLRVSLTQRQYAGEAPLQLELAPQSALVAIDPHTRHVLAMVGSYEADPGGLNRAMFSRRQPASTFKPVGYAYALHSGQYSPGSTMQLLRSRHTGPRGDPRNWRSLRKGLAFSNNEMALDLFRNVGLLDVVQFAHEIGIESEMAVLPSLALGAFEVTLLELTNTYATFASGGLVQEPIIVKSLVAADGTHVDLPTQPAKRVLSPATAYLMTSMLESVVQEGTGRRARKLKRPVAGKTGTNDAAVDAWFIGYSPSLVVGVWVGFDDGSPLGKLESGSHTALPTWVDFMRAAHRSKPVEEFARPETVTEVEIDPTTALLPYEGQEDTVLELFERGREPTEHASPRSKAPPWMWDAGTGDAGQPPIEEERP